MNACTNPTLKTRLAIIFSPRSRPPPSPLQPWEPCIYNIVCTSDFWSMVNSIVIFSWASTTGWPFITFSWIWCCSCTWRSARFSTAGAIVPPWPLVQVCTYNAKISFPRISIFFCVGFPAISLYLGIEEGKGE